MRNQQRRPWPAVLPLVLTLAALLPAARAAGQVSPDGVWTVTADAPGALQALGVNSRALMPTRYSVFAVDAAALQRVLDAAPLESVTEAQKSATILTLPMPDGTFARYRVVESPFLGPDVQALLPDYRSYLGQGIDDPTATVRFDMSGRGFHAYGLSQAGTLWIDPWERDRTDQVISAWKRDFPPDPDGFNCQTPDSRDMVPQELRKAIPASGSQLRTYRLAMTGTNEYFCYFDDWCGVPFIESEDAGLSALATTVNRINAIFEVEAAIRFSYVAVLLWYPSSDPFATGSTVNDDLLNTNQAQIDANWGSANYDIGHIVSAGGGGGYAPGRACVSGSKAKGGTSRSAPSGDPFDVDFVAHEVGHQLSAGHTFNGTTGSCNGTQWQGWRMEPGSGSTIMGYAGICGSENLQAHSDAYFHVKSLEDIVTYRNGGGACGTTSATGNTPPVANAGPDATIPRGTPFYLNGSGTDANGDVLTYTWEQYDNAAPLFRSFSPSTGGNWRYFPDWDQIFSGASDPWEVLPATDRTMHFRLTVRDNRAGGGGVDDDEAIVTVSGAPFFVTYPNGGESFTAGQPFTATWTVGGGSSAPTVNVWLYHGGWSFLANTPNDGSEALTMPCGVTSSACRLWIEANTGSSLGAHFLDVSNANFALANGTPDYSSYQPAGWGDKIVVRPTADGSASSAPLPATLTGDATSYVNWSYINSGSAYGCGAFENVSHLDERTVFTANSVPAVSGWWMWWNWGVFVSGGRHTAWQVSDPNGNLAESNESNNGYARQWVWSPPALNLNTLVVRSAAPPQKDAGQAYIPVGTTFVQNVDGFRIPVSTNAWKIVGLSNPDATADYDLRIHAASTGVSNGFDAYLESSTAGVGNTDAILINTRNAGNTAVDAGVLNFNTKTTGYRLEYRQSAPPLALGGTSAANPVAQDQVVWVGEFFVGSGDLGYVTLELKSVTTSQPVTLALYDRSLSYGGLYESVQTASVGAGGTAYLTRNLTTSGYYGVTVYRHAKDGTAPFTFDLKVWKTPADLATAIGVGSLAPIVPRDLDEPLPGPPFTAPTVLVGDAARTAEFIHWENTSVVGSPQYHVSWMLDGAIAAEFDFGAIGPNSGVQWQAASPFHIRGGRHTLGLFVDSQNTNAEIFENNNRFGGQWIWTPTSMVFGTPIPRGSPPSRSGGHADIPVGTTVYDNVDGLRSPVFAAVGDNGYWGAVAVMPGDASDVDLRLHAVSPDPASGFDTNLVESAWGAGHSDYVLVNLNNASGGAYDLGILDYNSTQGYTAEAVASTFLPALPVDIGPITLGSGHILDLYEVYLDAGSYHARLENVDGDVNWGFTVHDVSVTYDNLSGDGAARNWVADSAGAGQAEWLNFDVPTAGYHGVTVWKRAGADLVLSGDYRLRIVPQTTDVAPQPTLPSVTALSDVRPNPFNPRTTVSFDLARAGAVRMVVYDAAGRAVRTLVDETRAAGRHAVVWDGQDDAGRQVASGVYVVRLDSQGTFDQRKAVLVK